MPSKTAAQHKLMAAAANNPAFAKKVGVPQSVGRESVKADKGRSFGDGAMAESKRMVGKEVAFMKKNKAPKSMIRHEESEMKKMKMGGMATKMGTVMAGGKKPHGEHSIQKKGMTKGKQVMMRRYDEGGEVEVDEPSYAADVDDEAGGELMAARLANRDKPKPVAKPAAKVAKPAAKAPVKPPAKPAATDTAAARRRIVERERAQQDRPSPIGNMFRAMRAQGTGPSDEDTAAARRRIVERERAQQDRPSPIGNTFRAMRAQGMAKGGSVNGASRRGDGIAQRGKTKGRVI